MGKCLFMRKGETHTSPSTGILASDIAVGSIVKLMENGSPVEYLVVNQGIPSNSSLYDSSCDGMWLLRKDVKEKQKWDSNDNRYELSWVHSYLNGNFFALYDSVVQTTVKQVIIPYVSGLSNGVVKSGENGLQTKIFLLSNYEIGFTTADNGNFYSDDGAKLGYFESGETDSAKGRRNAYLNGTSTLWWTRCPPRNSASSAWIVGSTKGTDSISNSNGIRPALILPSNALFDTKTLILKGVA